MPGCVIGDDASIGERTVLHANVVVYPRCVIGARTVVHAGAVIGADGFGMAEEGGRWLRIPQVGRVVIGDDCEIGANTTIDRGAIDDTVIEDDVKLDNQIQIGHNCTIGAHTAIAGCVGIAGSVRIGRNCQIGGAAMISGHLTLPDGHGGVGRHVHRRDARRGGRVHGRVSGVAASPLAEGGVPTAPSRRARRARAGAREHGESSRAEGENGDERRPGALDVDAIVASMPHRYPAVLVDRILECVPGQSIRALKNVTMNEPYFQGHFPAYPVMPGVLILEALTQLSGVLAVASGLTTRGRRARRQVRRHRRLPLQAAGDARRPADARVEMARDRRSQRAVLLWLLAGFLLWLQGHPEEAHGYQPRS